MLSKLKKSIARKGRKQAGMALIETVIALGVLLAVAVGVMTLAAISMTTTENQGHLQARTAEYAQDKMEQLLALTFCDFQTDTTVFPAVVNATGTGLAGCTNLSNNPPTLRWRITWITSMATATPWRQAPVGNTSVSGKLACRRERPGSSKFP